MLVAPHRLALFALAAGALIVVPGPAVLYIVARSVSQGRRAGVVSALGVATGGLAHVTAAVLGVSALLAASPLAFGAVRWIGAGYLVLLGVRSLLRGDEAAAQASPPMPARRIYGQGVLVNLLNPKTALFFVAFLPQFVDPARGHTGAQLLLLGVLFVGMAIVSDTAYALLSGTLVRRLGGTPRSRRRARLFGAGTYLALGLGAVLAGGP